MRKGIPVGVILTAAMVLTAFFLPWGTAAYAWAELEPTMNGQPIDGQAMRDFFAGLSGQDLGEWLKVPLNPWQQTWSVGPLELPHWLVLAAALWVTGLTLLARVPQARVPRWLAPLFCVYGLVHLGYVGTTLIPHGVVGIGFILTAAAFVAMTVAVLLDSRSRGRIPKPDDAQTSLPRPVALSRTIVPH